MIAWRSTAEMPQSGARQGAGARACRLKKDCGHVRRVDPTRRLPRPRSRRRDAGAGHGPAPDGGDQGPVLRLLPRLDGARARGRISHRDRRVGERRSPQSAPRRAAGSRRLPHRRGRRLRGRRACAGGGDPAPARGTAGRHRRLRSPACRSARRAWRWRARRRRSTRSCCSDRRDGGASRVIGPSRNSKGRRMRAGNSSTKRAAASSLDRHQPTGRYRV